MKKLLIPFVALTMQLAFVVSGTNVYAGNTRSGSNEDVDLTHFIDQFRSPGSSSMHGTTFNIGSPIVIDDEIYDINEDDVQPGIGTTPEITPPNQ